MNRQEIAPAVYGLLQECQPTSASVERSFSMLNKLVAKDRNFLSENVKHYICVHYNLSTKKTKLDAFYVELLLFLSLSCFR